MNFPLPLAARSHKAARGAVELVIDESHFRRVVLDGMLGAKTSLDIATADFKAMLIPDSHSAGNRRSREAPSIIDHLRRLAGGGVEIRLLLAGTPSSAALRALKKKLPARLTIRRCPRLHAKAIVIDCSAMYLGSANLTGAGLGAKAEHKRNFEWGTWTTSPALIDSVLDQFNSLWEGRRCEKCRRKEICPVPLEEPSL